MRDTAIVKVGSSEVEVKSNATRRAAIILLVGHGIIASTEVEAIEKELAEINGTAGDEYP